MFTPLNTSKQDSMVCTAPPPASPAATSSLQPRADIDMPEESPPKHSLSYVVRSGLAGGVAGCAAKTLIAPLDRVKILFQTRNPEFLSYSGRLGGLGAAIAHIKGTQGFMGLFKGHSITLLRVFPYAGIKFVAYEQYRSLLIKGRKDEVPWRRFAAGSLSGVTSVFFTYPMDVVRVRLAVDTKSGTTRQMRSLLHKIAYQSGSFSLYGFYSGFVPTILGMIPYAGVSFLAHDLAQDTFRSRLLRAWAVDPSRPRTKNNQAGLTNWAELCAGGISGLLAQTAAYPLEIVRRRMQVEKSRKSMAAVAGKIYAEAGLRGFFVGLSIGYIKVVPMFACSFFVYERAKEWVGI